MIILWGKKRVGKTELVKKFIDTKRHVYFLSEPANEKEQLRRFSVELGNYYKEPLLTTRGFANWEESFRYIKEKDMKLVLVFDEFTHLIQANRGNHGYFPAALG